MGTVSEVSTVISEHLFGLSDADSEDRLGWNEFAYPSSASSYRRIILIIISGTLTIINIPS